jgi:acyl-CoA thioester hydrolase
VRPHPGRLDLSIYPHKVEVQTRFADVDPQWHLNNVRILELYQEARASFNLIFWQRSSFDTGSSRLLVARQSVDYLSEVTWPGTVCVGVGVARLGNASYSIGLAMFQNAKCVGISDVVLVHATEQGSARLPQNIRDGLAAQMLPQTAGALA